MPTQYAGIWEGEDVIEKTGSIRKQRLGEQTEKERRVREEEHTCSICSLLFCVSYEDEKGGWRGRLLVEQLLYTLYFMCP